MYVYTIVSFCLYIYLVLSHYLDSDKHRQVHQDYLDGTLGGIFPAFYFYSRYQPDTAYAYALTNAIFSNLGMAISLYLWVKFDERAKYQAIFQEDGIIYARLLFNSWNWNVDNPYEKANKVEYDFNEITLKLEDAKVRDRVSMRSEKEKNRIQTKRILLFLVDFVFLIIGWVIIFYGVYYESDMKAFVRDEIGITQFYIVEFTPAITASLVNYIVPYILGILT